MNGAESLIQTLVASGVDVCFSNPGTSEMHFVSALDRVSGMRPVLVLFEGVASGAADGFGRMTGRPAATLLHLGPGLSNAQANLHNARRAGTPLINIVGDHATSHRAYDAPLASDILGLAQPLSHWVRSCERPDELAGLAAQAVRIARTPPGRIVTLVLPADVSWSEANGPAAPLPPPSAAEVPAASVRAVADTLRRGEPSALLLGGPALTARGIAAAERIARSTGARLFNDTFVPRMPRGAGLPQLARLGYFAETALQELAGTRHLILVGTKAPVAFFAYPDRPSSLVPDGCTSQLLAAAEDHAESALERLADELAAAASGARLAPLQRPAAPTGPLNSQSVGAGIAAFMPEHAIVIDEGNTEGIFTWLATRTAPTHDWLQNTGGSIGLGLPLALGAALACPDRKVICLEGDGSAMYTLQTLWTLARERLDVTVIVFANRSYRILNIELGRVGASAGPRSEAMLSLRDPDLDFVALARGLGVEASRPQDAGAFCRVFERAMRERGPMLIECLV
jgi:acetolactate synthase-1/2/3 large subunit